MAKTAKANLANLSLRSAPQAKTETITLAGGCFWCLEGHFSDLPGVISAVSGYAGGNVDNPSYEEVSSGSTGHYESVKVTFDPSKISFADVLSHYWKQIDPLNSQGQFFDIGPQYRTVIFYHSPVQKKAAEDSKKQVEDFLGQPVATQVLPFKNFFKAEDYHQHYAKTCPLPYMLYKKGSGREARLNELWQKK